MVALLAPGGTLRDSLGGTLFHSELVAKRQTSIEQRESIVLRAEDVSHYFKFPSEQALHQFNLRAEGGQLWLGSWEGVVQESQRCWVF